MTRGGGGGGSYSHFKMNVIRCNARVIDSALLAGDDLLLISLKNKMNECTLTEFQFVRGTSVITM